MKDSENFLYGCWTNLFVVGIEAKLILRECELSLFKKAQRQHFSLVLSEQCVQNSYLRFCSVLTFMWSVVAFTEIINELLFLIVVLLTYL